MRETRRQRPYFHIDDDLECETLPYLGRIDAYLSACEAERQAVNGGREAARRRVLAALDRVMQHKDVIHARPDANGR